MMVDTLEDFEQIILFAWIDLNTGQHPDLALAFHVPNGGHRNPQTGAHLKRLGVRPGVPDILLPVARQGFHGLVIELKRTAGGRISEHQKRWLERFQNQNWRAVVCHGADEAIEIIKSYLDI